MMPTLVTFLDEIHYDTHCGIRKMNQQIASNDYSIGMRTNCDQFTESMIPIGKDWPMFNQQNSHCQKGH